MQSSKFDSQSGKSLVELLVVLAIAAIIVTMAVTQLGASTDNLERQNITREFKVSLERARFDSVRRRASVCDNMARVTFNSATQYTLLTDLNQNGVLEPGTETRTFDFEKRGGIELVGNSLVYPIVVRFDQRGSATTGECGSLSNNIPVFTFCVLPCTASTANALNSSKIYVSPTGTATMLNGGEGVPTFGNPTVTNVNTSTQVNPLLAVWDPDSVSPSPSPSADPSPAPSASPSATPNPTPDPTPTPLPTATPTPNPTVTPTPAPTATPTATPAVVYCAYGEKPSLTGCTCQSPMWVRTNGKCQ